MEQLSVEESGRPPRRLPSRGFVRRLVRRGSRRGAERAGRGRGCNGAPPARGALHAEAHRTRRPPARTDGGHQRMHALLRAGLLRGRTTLSRQRHCTQFRPGLRRYGITDPASVRTWGCHLPHGRRPKSAASIGAPPDRTRLSPAARLVLPGPDPNSRTSAQSHGTLPAGGCLGDANREVNGDTAVELQPGHGATGLVETLKAEGFQASSRDHRVTEAFRRWSTCMARQGYRVKDPLNAAPASMSRPAPTPAEIKQARPRRTPHASAPPTWSGTWFAAESAHQLGVIKQHARDLDQAAAARRTLAARVHRLLEQYGAGAHHVPGHR